MVREDDCSLEPGYILDRWNYQILRVIEVSEDVIIMEESQSMQRNLRYYHFTQQDEHRFNHFIRVRNRE